MGRVFCPPFFLGESMEDFFQIGIVTTAHGVHGELKVFPTTDDAKRFKKLKNLYIVNGKTTVTKKVESVKFFKQFVILKLEGIDTMDDALLYRNAKFLVERKDAVKCEKDEYFIADLIGVSVFDEEEKFIGELTEVYQTGANDVYEITTKDERQVLLPAIKDCIIDVNIKDRKMTVRLMEGLM